MVARVEVLRALHETLPEIAATLNAEGYHPAKRTSQFTKGILSHFLRERQAQTGTRSRLESNERHLKAGEWWLADLASELSMPIATLHRWKCVGWVSSRKVMEAGGRWAIYADVGELERLSRLQEAPRGWPQTYPTELITPRPKADDKENRSQ